ncbi:MAG: glutamate--tRNA ligase [bacterium]
MTDAADSLVTKQVRVRIAPSPTGTIHLGLARTALYNWLFARRHDGRFVLRIDDTDAERNVADSLQPILDGLRWLGLDWDEGPEKGGPHEPYYQSQRVDRHRAAVAELLRSDCAYRDYATSEEMKAEREAAIAAKLPWRYSRRWMAATDADQQRFEAEGRQSVVRLKMPQGGTLVIEDLVRGRVEFEWALEQDHVVQRGDGSCLYHLANVVDDHDFEISHVIRAEEHLSNTPRQVFIARSLGWSVPVYAHLPYVAEPGSRNKLSKRKVKQYLKNPDFAELVEHGRRIAAALGRQVSEEDVNPVALEFYRDAGFLPQSLVNYLALLGWSLDDKAERFDLADLVREFSLERVNRAPASFDPAKLVAFQVRRMMEMSVGERVEIVLPFLARAGLVAQPATDVERVRVAAIIAAAGDRIKVAGDVLDYRDFFFATAGLQYDAKAFDKQLRRPGAAALLGEFRARLAALERFEAADVEAALGAFAAGRGIKVGDIIHALRVAVTGKAVGFGLFEALAILGRESCLERIDRAVAEATRQ